MVFGCFTVLIGFLIAIATLRNSGARDRLDRALDVSLDRHRFRVVANVGFARLIRSCGPPSPHGEGRA